MQPDDMRPPPPPLDDEPPRAEIEQTGRWTYRVLVIHGLMGYGPDGYGWLRLGRRWAEAKARRELARYVRNEVRHENRWSIR